MMQKVLVMAKKTHLDKLGEIAAGLATHGFVQSGLIERIGVFHGTVSTENKAKLSTVPGVECVEDERMAYTQTAG